MQGHRLGQRAASELDDRRDIGQAGRKSPHEGGTDPAFSDHIRIGAAPDDFLPAAELRDVHQQRKAGLLPQQAPPFHIGQNQGVLDHPHHGRAFQFLQDSQDGGKRPVVIEIVVHLESRRRHLLHGPGLFNDVVIRAGMDLEDHVSFANRPLDVFGQVFRRRGPGPGGHGYPVAYLLAHEFVRGNLEMLAHGVVKRPHQARIQIGVDEVEGIAPDNVFDGGPVGRLAARVAVPDDAVVRCDLENGTVVQVDETRFLIGIPRCDFRVDRNDFDVGDFHVDFL